MVRCSAAHLTHVRCPSDNAPNEWAAQSSGCIVSQGARFTSLTPSEELFIELSLPNVGDSLRVDSISLTFLTETDADAILDHH